MLTDSEEKEIMHQWSSDKTLDQKFHWFMGAAEFCNDEDKWDDLFTLATLIHYKIIKEV